MNAASDDCPLTRRAFAFERHEVSLNEMTLFFFFFFETTAAPHWSGFSGLAHPTYNARPIVQKAVTPHALIIPPPSLRAAVVHTCDCGPA